MYVQAQHNPGWMRRWARNEWTILETNGLYTVLQQFVLAKDVWPNGKALDYESRDSRFDPWYVHTFLLSMSLSWTRPCKSYAKMTLPLSGGGVNELKLGCSGSGERNKDMGAEFGSWPTWENPGFCSETRRLHVVIFIRG